MRRRSRSAMPPTYGPDSFVVEIADGDGRWMDVYRFHDLPLPLRRAVVGWREPRLVTWSSPDGSRWTVRSARL